MELAEGDAQALASHDNEKAWEKQPPSEVPSLQREKTEMSVASDAAIKTEESDVKANRSFFFVIKRLASINRDVWPQYLCATISAIGNGGAYPAMGVVFALGIDAFSDSTNGQRRHDGDRTALWFFIIALAAMVVNAIQHTYYGITSTLLSSRLRGLAFRAILRQDVEFFDKDENNTGQLTASLTGNATKVRVFAGVTATIIVQSLATLVIGAVLGLIFAWQIGLVGIACTPIMLSAGYVRLVRCTALPVSQVLLVLIALAACYRPERCAEQEVARAVLSAGV